MKKQSTTLQLAMTGLMAALVFVGSMIQITIPLSVGTPTRIHFGNIFCLLAGLLLGPVRGGLSAGIGSFFFDLLNPLYIADSPFTFLFKFSMGFLSGKVSHVQNNSGENVKLNFVAAALGQLAYLILYAGKALVENLFLYRMEFQPALVLFLGKLGASSLNAIIAVAISVPLCLVVRRALKSTHIFSA